MFKYMRVAILYFGVSNYTPITQVLSTQAFVRASTRQYMFKYTRVLVRSFPCLYSFLGTLIAPPDCLCTGDNSCKQTTRQPSTMPMSGGCIWYVGCVERTDFFFTAFIHGPLQGSLWSAAD